MSNSGVEDKCELWHGSEFNKLPVIEGDVGKNKVTERTSRHYFKFFPAQSRYETLTVNEASSLVSYNRTVKAEERGHEGTWRQGKYYPNGVEGAQKITEEDIPF